MVGAPGHYVADGADFAAGVDCLLADGASVNIYMALGGTSFGFAAGGELMGRDGKVYSRSFVTSYDFDAPLAEGGDTTPKWHALRAVFARHGAPVNASAPAPPRTAVGGYGPIHMTHAASLLSVTAAGELGPASSADAPRSFEALGAGYGYVLYTGWLPANASGSMAVVAQDRAWIAIDGTWRGVAGWWRPSTAPGVTPVTPASITVEPAQRARRLDVLVANLGRCADALLDLSCGARGLLHPPAIGGIGVSGPWRMTPLALDDLSNVTWTPLRSAGTNATNATTPLTLYRGTMVVPAGGAPLATYLRFDGWGSGIVLVNRFNLGKFDGDHGPQRTLYVPAALLRPGENEVIALETGGSGPTDARASAAGERCAIRAAPTCGPRLVSVSHADLGPPRPM